MKGCNSIGIYCGPLLPLVFYGKRSCVMKRNAPENKQSFHHDIQSSVIKSKCVLYKSKSSALKLKGCNGIRNRTSKFKCALYISKFCVPKFRHVL